MILEKIRSLLGMDTGIRVQLKREMNTLIKKDKSILKALLLTNDGLSIYSYGFDGVELEFFAVKISSFISLVIKKVDGFGLKGDISYVQMETDNGSILVAVSKKMSLVVFTDKKAELSIIKALTKNALKKFEELFR